MWIKLDFYVRYEMLLGSRLRSITGGKLVCNHYKIKARTGKPASLWLVFIRIVKVLHKQLLTELNICPKTLIYSFIRRHELFVMSFLYHLITGSSTGKAMSTIDAFECLTKFKFKY